ncbi:hypothetical protein JOC24_006481 [Streptomyces sp. HB132]|nr:hypothetical protein [Streptomyces sp. HB132]
MLALTGLARYREPKKLRPGRFSGAARFVTTAADTCSAFTATGWLSTSAFTL